MKLFGLTFFILANFICSAYSQSSMKWLNEPKKWSDSNGKIIIETPSKTDYWRTTFYKYITSNAPFYFKEVSGEFTAKTKVRGEYKDLYDQAGLMVMTDDKNWIKAGVEFVNDTINLSTVVTRDFSDWSVVSLDKRPTFIWIKMIRKGDSMEVQYSYDDTKYYLLRLAYFPPGIKAKIGVMTAAPEGKGFTAIFENFTIEK